MASTSSFLVQLLLVFISAMAEAQLFGRDQVPYPAQSPGGGGFNYFGFPPGKSSSVQEGRNEFPVFQKPQFAWIGLPQYFYPVYVTPPPPSAPSANAQFQAEPGFNGGGRVPKDRNLNWTPHNFLPATDGWDREGGDGDLQTASSRVNPKFNFGSAVGISTDCPMGYFLHPATKACVKSKGKRGG